MSAAVHGEKPVDPAVLEPGFVAGVAAAEISKWDLDPTASAEIRRKMMDSPAEAKAKGGLNMARNYVAAKQFEQAKAKYADVVKLYPGTVCANVAANELAELPTPEVGKQWTQSVIAGPAKGISGRKVGGTAVFLSADASGPPNGPQSTAKLTDCANSRVGE